MPATSQYLESVSDKHGLCLGLSYDLPCHFVHRPNGYSFPDKMDGRAETKPIHCILTFEIFSGRLFSSQKTADWHEIQKNHCFIDLSPFEIVNYHQWHGLEAPKKHYFARSSLFKKEQEVIFIETERLEFATVDNSQARRVAVGTSHAAKDDQFRILVQLNTLLEQARQLAAPFEPEIRANFAGGRLTIETDEDREMMADIVQAWRENRPPLAWMASPSPAPEPTTEEPEPPQPPRKKRMWQGKEY